MKTRIMIKNLRLALFSVFLMIVSVSGYSQACTGNIETVSLANFTQTATTVEYDIMVSNTGTTSMRSSATTVTVLFSAGTLPPGATGSISVVDTPTSTGNFPGHGAGAPLYNAGNRSLRFAGTPNAGSTTMLTTTPLKYARIRFTSSLPWVENTAATFTINPTNGSPTATTTGTSAVVYCNGNTNTAPLAFSTGTMALGGPYPVILAPAADTCFTSGSASGIVPTVCFGDATGSATITMSPAPSSNAITYTVDGGASTSGTLVANAFSVSGLAAGDHTVVVTGSGTCTTPRTVNFTVGGPLSPLTNVTNETACDSFTWSVTGLSYTTSGTYTGTSTNGSGCSVSETLNLTINNSTSGTNNATACDTFTWSGPLGNGQTYTTSQTGLTHTSTNAAGCPHVETLNLTINNSTSGTNNATACDTFTWSGPLGNGQTYTTSQTGLTHTTTNAAGCPHVETLNLTINNSTTDNSLTITANDTYTWSLGIGGNGTTYTTSGVYTFVTTNAAGCPNTATLTLTINITGVQTTWYQDFDGDTYGNPAVSVLSVSQPVGYVANNTDCNDAVAAINPGHVEVLYNGVDDNCDGNLDEGFQITTTLQGCGSTLSTIGSLIAAVSLGAPITGYRFEVTTVGSFPLEVQVVNGTGPNFSLTQLPSYAYATTYSIRVMLQRNGIWLGYYGPACNISSPAILAPGGAASVTPSQCGITLPTISTLIATNSIAGVTGYKFRVTNQRTGFQQELTRTLHWFSLTMLTQYVYGDTYSVEVAVKTTGDFSGYGTPCNVTAPPVPSLTTQCGTTIATKTTNVTTSSLALVTSYDFEVRNMTSNVTANVSNNLNWFRLSMLPNYAASTQFRVRVRVLTSGTFSDYGDACFITSPAVARTVETVDNNIFEVTASPNPFDNNFGMFLNSSSTQDVSIRVYDMIGKLVEQREVKSGDVVMQEIGARFPSGVYNVIVTQGAEVKTLRVIKR